MSYEDSFYVADNIVGYTGDLNDNPTVYFQLGNKFGRITQDHPKADNIGRNKVREYEDYSHTNNSQNKAEEFYGGKVRHTSRNPFIPSAGLDGAEMSELAKAIEKFPDIKSKY